jgi:predicted GNAT family acetyltransferase
VADAIVDVGPVSTIQQVYTRLDHRGTGNASRLVTAIGGRLGALGKAATYLVAEDNGASVRVAEKSGYSLLGRVGCAQLR